MNLGESDYWLGQWAVMPTRCAIQRGSETVHVKPKSMAVLACLAAAKGQVVSRQRLFDTVWPGGIVTDDVLTQCIVELRKAFGDNAKNPSVIETVPKIGFRLLPRSTTRHKKSTALFAGAAGIGLVLFAFVSWLAIGDTRISSTGSLPANSTVAVLPFIDLSENNDQAYFADGLAEELINQLSGLDGLRVTARTSSFHFRNRNESIAEIGRQLGVTHLVEGSVRKSGSNLRVTAQLVDASSGFQVWSETFDGPIQDLFLVQERISGSVANALSISLQVGELGRKAGSTSNVEAYDEFMHASALYREYDAANIIQAISHFERATQLDPDYAEAWERLADVYRNAWLVFGLDQAPLWRARSEAAMARAQNLAPDSDFVIRTIAFTQVDNGEWIEAEKTLRRFDAQEPFRNYRLGGVYIDLLSKVGKAREAIVTKELQRSIDPIHSGFNFYLAHLYAMEGRLADALTELERGYELGHFRAQISIEGLLVAMATGKDTEVEKWLGRAIEYRQPGARGINLDIERHLHDPAKARDILRQAFDTSTSTDYFVAAWASYLGDDELVIEALRRSPDGWLLWSPVINRFRNTKEFKQILTDMNIVEYWREFGWSDFCSPVGQSDFECS